MKTTAKEFWQKRFWFRPLTGTDKLAIGMMEKYVHQVLVDQREEIAEYYDSIESKGEMIYPSEVAYYLRHLKNKLK